MAANFEYWYDKKQIGEKNRMRKNGLAIVTVVALCAGAVFGVRAYQALKNPAAQAPAAALPAMAKGNPRAEVRIVEYIDYQCMACQKASKHIRGLMDRHPGKIYLEVRFFPLSMHRHGFASAVLAQCAAEQGKFWELHERLFETQLWWGGLDDPASAFLGFGRTLGLDITRLEACIASETAKAKVEAGRAEAQALGVRSTPTFLVNGKMVVGIFELPKALAEYFPDEAGRPIE